MSKAALIIALIAILCLGLLIWFKWFKFSKNQLYTPIAKTLAEVLGFPQDNKQDYKRDGKNFFDQTKDSLTQNSQKTIESVKTTVYNEAKTTLDNVFDKQTSEDKNGKEVNITVLGVTNQTADEDSFVIDLAKDQNLNMKLSLNKKYYFKFKNIPTNYCIYINNLKHPISEGTLEIQFTKTGNYPIKASSCEINDKNIGTLIVQ